MVMVSMWLIFMMDLIFVGTFNVLKIMLSIKTVKRILKPPIFLICLVPFVLVLTDAFELTGNLGANPIENIQDRFGNWGLRFILITLSITPLKILTGKNWLIQFRRMFGLFAFFYVAMHFLVWFILEQNMLMSAIIEDISIRPFITIGFLALLILLLLTLTSTNNIQRKLKKNWYVLHRLLYVASILAVWHYWWQVKKDITEPLIYAIILISLLLFRVWDKD